MTMRQKCLAVAAAALALVTALSAPASAAPATCAAPTPSTTHPGYLVFDPACDVSGAPFTPLTDASGKAISKIYTGIRDGAAYRVEVPLRWNGKLVVYAHGYRGTGTVVYVDNPALRAHYLQTGYAWAASSYATNGYDVGQGVRDSYAMIDTFRAATGHRARSVIMSGASMGGQVTAVAIERFPHAFAAAMPYCGVLGDTRLYDYFLDANVTAAALARVKIDFPLTPAADYPAQWHAQVGRITAALGVKVGSAPALTPAGKIWSDVVERRTGGERPGFDSAFAYWNAAPSLAPLSDLPFLFGLYPGLTGGTGGIAPGNVTDNQFTFYRADDYPWPSFAELRLNADVLRVRHTATGDPGLSGIPRVEGRPTIPVLSLHDVGDLFVPFAMEQDYALRAARNGRAGLFVSRAIRGVGHCDFTEAELAQGFDDLTRWVRTGQRPAGDAILDRRQVAADSFGCRFTNGAHPTFIAAVCPAQSVPAPAPDPSRR
ncbi:o-phthalyl amidase [Actinoplanes sp. SE50]|uniref:alpha/beta hydrolase family protein n=1 Tax=unclassified Actinoplanes TaxID=2626549 RepID=UPI00023EC30E|nr:MULTISPECIES: prolyl oligopeptidase family serine peptidase [unclassified Actinoplanes]AEV86360.1 o-phthalyl amidase [Actinoplanes sp. SE50/110]ATO84757.1 o-phthalyl amidase [Actinoplanes sp. SE50]SLM02167.1 o-phthalyl amidase [Actinoplanes sp. SE50/110]